MQSENESNANRKTLTLPSGGQITIRRPGPLAVRILASGQPATAGRGRAVAAESLSEIEEKTYGALVSFVCTCVTSPRLSVQEPPPAETNYIDDVLTVEDFNFVLSELVSLAGLAQAEEKLRPLSATVPSS